MSNPKLIPRIFGGLGNQLFCYAAARRLALVDQAELVIDDVSGFVRDHGYQRHYQLGHFNIPCRKATPAERLEPFSRVRRYLKRRWNQRLPFAQRAYLVQAGIDFDPCILHFKPQGTVYLEGYWQTHREQFSPKVWTLENMSDEVCASMLYKKCNRMPNPSFPKQACTTVTTPYVAPYSIVNRTTHGDEAFDTGMEYRLQPAYGEELWLKLERAGLTPDVLSELFVLEVCAGTGFLTFHLLSRCSPKSLTVNDVSASEMEAAQHLMQEHYPDATISRVLGDMHAITLDRKFDLIIGSSFLHHFYNVPQVLARFHELLNPGGLFITLHEPTPMSTVVEGGEIFAWPLAVVAPELVNNIARARHKGEPSATDLWMFEPALLKQVALQSGFKSVDFYSWGLLRPLVVQRYGWHASADKPQLSEQEAYTFCKAVKIDSYLNRILPHRCFGSICLVCRK